MYQWLTYAVLPFHHFQRFCMIQIILVQFILWQVVDNSCGIHKSSSSYHDTSWSYHQIIVYIIRKEKGEEREKENSSSVTYEIKSSDVKNSLWHASEKRGSIFSMRKRDVDTAWHGLTVTSLLLLFFFLPFYFLTSLELHFIASSSTPSVTVSVDDDDHSPMWPLNKGNQGRNWWWWKCDKF